MGEYFVFGWCSSFSKIDFVIRANSFLCCDLFPWKCEIGKLHPCPRVIWNRRGEKLLVSYLQNIASGNDVAEDDHFTYFSFATRIMIRIATAIVGIVVGVVVI